MKTITGKFAIAGELLAYMWRMKLWWMFPLVTLLLFFGLLIAVGNATGVGPFIYTLF
jgi:hypothetical protein